MHPSLDCVVVGFNDQPLGPLLAEAARRRHESGLYRVLRLETVPLGSERVHYMQFLRRALRAGGRDYGALDWTEVPSLTLCYLTSYLRRRGFSVDFVNSFQGESERLTRMLGHSPRLVAIPTTLYTADEPIIEIVRGIRDRSPGSHIVVGGPHILNLSSRLSHDAFVARLRRIGADAYVLEGQGEYTLARLLSATRQSLGVPVGTANLIVRDADGTVRFGPREVEDNDLDADAPDWTGLAERMTVPTAYIRTARSCAFRCAFCSYPSLGGPLRFMHEDTVEQQLRSLRAIGVRYLGIVDDTFNVPSQRFKRICEMLRRHGFQWVSYFRCQEADEDAVDRMAESGCLGVFLGIESGDQGVLQRMNKRADVSVYRRMLRRLNEAGIWTYASLIVGFPGETGETIARTLEFLEDSRPTFFRPELFYFDSSPQVPISRDAIHYQLTGSGYGWRHATMEWPEACEWADFLAVQATGSVLLPSNGFNLWAVPYLLAKGLTLHEIKDFARVAHRAIVSDLIGPSSNASSKHGAGVSSLVEAHSDSHGPLDPNSSDPGCIV